jgi:hypothetical protein
MTDLDLQHQHILSAFGWDQWRSNHAGIGNECTHWIYAALLEARALDHDPGLHIAQNGQHYTWGRRIEPAAALAGDIVQFRNYLNRFLFWFRDERRWLRQDLLRGPMHTAMVATTQSHTFEGQHLLLESHLHQLGVPRMTTRENRVYDANFAAALTTAQFSRVRGTTTWPASVDTTNAADLDRNVVWLRLRDDYPFPIHDADLAFHRIMHGSAPNIDSNIAFLFRLSTTGEIRFYRPQQSRERLAMNDAEFQAEKERVIAMMVRNGRPGDQATRGHPLDEYGSDNKQARQRAHLFNWRFNAPVSH